MVFEKQNTRKRPRYDLVLKVSYGGIRRLADYCENLSQEGIFIATSKVFEPGSEIRFEISLPGLVKPVRLRGEVIWRRSIDEAGEKLPAGIGVKLKFDNELERVWLKKLLEKVGREVSPPSRSKLAAAVNLLLAEDNIQIAAMFREAMARHPLAQQERLKIDFCERGEQALSLIERQRVDLLIIEWRLCREEGVDLFERIQAMEPGRRPLLLVLGREEEQARALAAGADAFLRRPFPAKGLLNTIGLLLEKRKPSEK